MDDVVKALQEAGFKPVANTDEDFPAIEGEYGVAVKTLRPWVNEETDTKEAYMLQLTITNTLSGDTADNRLLTRFYRIAGNGFNGEAITDQQAVDNVKRLVNDLFTLGVELDRTNTTVFEESFARAIDARGYARAWKALSSGERERHRQENHTSQSCNCKSSQQFRIKVEKDLRKASQETAAGTGARAPF